MKHLTGMQFIADADVHHTNTSWLETLDISFFRPKILVPEQDKCLNANGGYMEVWHLPSSRYV